MSVKPNDEDEFYQLIVKCAPPTLLGLAHALGIKFLTTNVDPSTHKAIPRDAFDIIVDCSEAFVQLSRKNRRLLLANLRNEVTIKEDDNVSS